MILWTMRILALLGLAGTTYLFATGLRTAPAPLGCGPGSGCDLILSGPWSRWLGIPVTGPAVVVYALLLLSSSALEPRVSDAGRRWAWISLLVLGAIASGSAIWFIFVQAALVGAFCPWCMAVHSCGLLLTALVILFAPISSRQPDAAPAKSTDPTSVNPTSPAQVDADDATANPSTATADTKHGLRFTPPRAAGLCAVGILLTAVMAFTQFMTREPTFRAVAIRGIDFPASDFPRIGRLDAEKLLLLFADPTCPHCRTLHRQLLELRTDLDNRFTIIMVPAPLHEGCNPLYGDPDPRIADGCDLSRLALAVWLADREQYEAFDRLIWSGSQAPGISEADARAQQLVGSSRLQQALTSELIGQRLRIGIEANAVVRQAISQTAGPTPPGIPTMLIGQQHIAGMPGPDDLRNLILNQLQNPTPANPAR